MNKMRYRLILLVGTLASVGCKPADSQPAPDTSAPKAETTPPAVPGQIKTIEETTAEGQRVVMQVKIGAEGEEVRHGTFTAYYPNGNKWGEEEYKDGIRHGKHLEWYSTGVKKREGQFVNDQQDGLWTEWDPNGNKTEETRFVAGMPVSPKPAASIPAAPQTPQPASAAPTPAPTTQPASP
jgi:hypothetical protein